MVIFHGYVKQPDGILWTRWTAAGGLNIFQRVSESFQSMAPLFIILFRIFHHIYSIQLLACPHWWNPPDPFRNLLEKLSTELSLMSSLASCEPRKMVANHRDRSWEYHRFHRLDQNLHSYWHPPLIYVLVVSGKNMNFHIVFVFTGWFANIRFHLVPGMPLTESKLVAVWSMLIKPKF